MWPELLRELPTRMYELHQWYMSKSKDGLTMFTARGTKELYGLPFEIWIDFEDLWLLYHQDALSKGLISAWIM